ncbi:MAG: aminodeoxychorismate synthase component I [Planctomycetales bacterium]|nr:aminodeoxychorismate synthase component I [Planctomycetales bacterium]
MPTLVQPLSSFLSAVETFQRLANLPGCLFLDSALPHETLGRYSFVTADPFDQLSVVVGDPMAFDRLARFVGRYTAQPLPNLPPFQGGVAGLFSYDLNRSIEELPAPACDQFALPAIHVGLYDVVVAFDHLTQEAWLISQGFPETSDAARTDRAAARMSQFQQWLSESPISGCPSHSAPSLSTTTSRIMGPHYSLERMPSLFSNFTRANYLAAVQHIVDYIHSGDIFQANFSQRLLMPAKDAAADLYLRLRNQNPAPFAGYYQGGDFQIASASPERFVRIDNGRVEARPIKGTRPRTRLPEADLYTGEELRASEKDQAENVMIVDLMRNDLSRVCQMDSIRVEQLCQVENYQFVQHLVSSVVGKLLPHRTAVDLLVAAFPGGSITGAPKIRAMQIITELEPHARGAYCGSLGYIGFSGQTDLSILIRTITAAQGWWQLPVGGGIVAQSKPQAEYDETWHKAEGILRSL